jgi:hypothetical protein
MFGFREPLRKFVMHRDHLQSNIPNSTISSVVIWGSIWLSLLSYWLLPDFFPVQGKWGTNTSPSQMSRQIPAESALPEVVEALTSDHKSLC